MFGRSKNTTKQVPAAKPAPAIHVQPGTRIALGTLLDDFPRGDPSPTRTDTSFTAPNARFREPDPSAGVFAFGKGGPSTAMFLGIVGGTVVNAGTKDSYVMGGSPIGITDDRHICTIAGSRAGKGRAAIVPNILTYPGSVLAIDPKGELATMTARHRRDGLNQSVYVLDPFNVASGAAIDSRRRFNPLAAMSDETLIEDAALIADALVIVEGKDPHWDESAKGFIEGVILHVRTARQYEGSRTLTTVRTLITLGADDASETTGRSLAALAVDMQNNGGPNDVDEAVRKAGADFFERSPKERDSVLSTTRRHLKFLDYPGIQRVSEGHDLNINTLKTEKTTVYLCLPARHIGTCSRWLRLFVNLTLQAMERVRTPPVDGIPVLCCLDEFASLGKLRQIEDAAGQIAGFGVKLWPVLQDLGQLKALYSERWETFLGNAGVLQFFGNNDLATLEWVSKRLGKTTIRVSAETSVTPGQRAEGSLGQSWSYQTYDLLGVDEAARFFRRTDRKMRQLIIAADIGAPLVLQRAYFDKHELFRGLYDEPPDHVKPFAMGDNAP